jgi:hypothetical protein
MAIIFFVFGLPRYKEPIMTVGILALGISYGNRKPAAPGLPNVPAGQDRPTIYPEEN